MNKAEKFWDKRSNRFDERFKKREAYIKAIVKTKKHLNSSDVVLDYACATGIIANEFAVNVKEIHAIDFSSKMIDFAKRKSGKAENIIFAQSTIFDESLKKESFEFNILHLLEDTPRVIQRINELLKPEGLFISTTPCIGEKTTFSSIFLVLLSKTGIVPYLKMSKISELEDLVVNGNFQIVESENLNGNPPNSFIVAKKTLRAGTIKMIT